MFQLRQDTRTDTR